MNYKGLSVVFSSMLMALAMSACNGENSVASEEGKTAQETAQSESVAASKSNEMVKSDAMTGDPSPEAIESVIQNIFPRSQMGSVMESEVPGVYQVELLTGEILHVSKDGKHIFSGDLFAVKGPGQFDNLTERYRSTQRTAILGELNEKDMVVFAPEGEPKGEVFVFTDVDCGYCRKFHEEVPRLNELGIQVNYLAWPRAGLNSRTGEMMNAVWCSSDPKAAMTKAKTRQGTVEPASKECKSPVSEQIILGRKLGVSGTPAVFLKDGKQVGGYLKAEDLIGRMGLAATTAAK